MNNKLISFKQTGQPAMRKDADGSVTISIPIAIKRHSGRTLEEGKVNSLHEMAEKEKVDSSYVSRMVNLILLAPDIVAGILDDQLPQGISLFDLAVEWDKQLRRFPGSPSRDNGTSK